MESILDKVMFERQRFLHKANNCKVNNQTININDAKLFLESLREFSRSFMTIDKDEFIRQNSLKLSFIRSTLLNKTLEFDENISKKFKNSYDAIFIPMGYNDYWSRKERNAIKKFTEFCKGITYFLSEFQIERYPIYHRNASCGSRRLTSNVRFVKTLYGPNMSEYIKRCVIERKIYDMVWTHDVGLQDLPHKYELEKVQRIYETYFPDEIVKVAHLDFDVGIPIRVQFDTYSKNTIIVSEIYEKSRNSENVYCFKKDYISNKFYEKIQTFDSKQEWIETENYDHTTPYTQTKVVLFQNSL